MNKKNISIRLKNTFPASVYDLDSKVFGIKRKVNLIELWQKSFSKIIGPGKVIIMPYGAISYMIRKNKILWDYVNDIDIVFYLFDIDTPYETWQSEEKIFPKVKKEFIRLSKKAGLNIYKDSTEKFLELIIPKEKRARKEGIRDFQDDLSSETFFKWIGYDKEKIKEDKEKRKFNNLKECLESYLIKKKIHPTKNIYYSWKYAPRSQLEYGNLVIASFIKAYFNNSRLFIPVYWNWLKTIKVIYEIFRELGLTNDSLEKFINKIIKKHLAYEIISMFKPFDVKEVEKRFPKISKYLYEGQVQTLFYYFTNGGEIQKEDIIVRDHIDAGSIESILFLMCAQEFKKKKLNQTLKLILNCDLIKNRPIPTKEHIRKRINGSLVGPQLFLFALNNLLNPVKEKSMSESEAINYLLSGGKNGRGILETLMEIIDKIVMKDYSLVMEYAKGGIKQLKNEFKKMKNLEKTRNLNKVYSFSKTKKTATISQQAGIQDLEIKYAFLPKNIDVLIQYSEIRNEEGRVVGYWYPNIGRFPGKTNVNLFGLMEVLSLIELLFREKKEEFTRRDLWISHSHPDIMMTGPSSSTYENSSVIPPLILAEIIEAFLEFKKKNKKKWKYVSLHYFELIKEFFYKKIGEFLLSKKMGFIFKKLLLEAYNLERKSDFLLEEGYLYIKGKKKNEEYFYPIKPGSLHFVPLNYYFSEGFYKKSKRWWDYIPKGYYYFLNYYGDKKAIKRLKAYLKKNNGGISEEDLIISALNYFYLKRVDEKEILTKEGTLKLIKESIRFGLVLQNEKLLNRIFKILDDYEKDWKKSNELIKNLLRNSILSIEKKEYSTQKIKKNIKKILF